MTPEEYRTRAERVFDIAYGVRYLRSTSFGWVVIFRHFVVSCETDRPVSVVGLRPRLNRFASARPGGASW